MGRSRTRRPARRGGPGGRAAGQQLHRRHRPGRAARRADRQGAADPVAAAARRAPAARRGGRRQGPGQDALPDGRAASSRRSSSSSSGRPSSPSWGASASDDAAGDAAGASCWSTTTRPSSPSSRAAWRARASRCGPRPPGHAALAAARAALAGAAGRRPDDAGHGRLRAVPPRVKRIADLPIIVLSAVDASEAKVRALEQYAEDYVTKPFDPDELVARIQRVLRRAAAGRAGDGRSTAASWRSTSPRAGVTTPAGTQPLTPTEVAAAAGAARTARPHRPDRDAARPRLVGIRRRRSLLRLGHRPPPAPQARGRPGPARASC